jgi:hypothetical protein
MIKNQYDYSFDFVLLTIDLTIYEFDALTAKFVVQHTITISDRSLADVSLETRGYFNDFDDLLYILTNALNPANYALYPFFGIESILEDLTTVRGILLSLPEYRSKRSQALSAYHEIIGMYNVLVYRLASNSN